MRKKGGLTGEREWRAVMLLTVGGEQRRKDEEKKRGSSGAHQRNDTASEAVWGKSENSITSLGWA